MLGKSVRIFLVDGSPTGLLTAEVMNWTGHALFFPRSRLKEALQRKEAGGTGVYLLVGEDPETTSRQKVYVGEGDNVGVRIRAHAEDDSKEFWTHACLFTSKDKNLTKAHVRYLEGRLIETAVEADRSAIANGTNPNVSGFLPESDTSDMEYFLAQIEVVLPVIGIDILRKKPTKHIPISQDPTSELTEKSPGILELTMNPKSKNFQATALEKDGEFVVLKGSTSPVEPGHSSTSHYDSLREQLKEDGVLVTSEADATLLEFSKDFTFKSPSAAASVINGRNSNGRVEWTVNSTGQSLKDYQLAELKALDLDLDLDLSDL